MPPDPISWIQCTAMIRSIPACHCIISQWTGGVVPGAIDSILAPYSISRSIPSMKNQNQERRFAPTPVGPAFRFLYCQIGGVRARLCEALWNAFVKSTPPTMNCATVFSLIRYPASSPLTAYFVPTSCLAPGFSPYQSPYQ